MGNCALRRLRRQTPRILGMKRLLLDSGVAADYVHRRSGVREQVTQRVRAGVRVGIGVPVLAELVFGIENSASRDRNMQTLITAIPSVRLWPFDKRAAFEFGRIAAELRRKGRPMQVMDM